MIDASLHLGYSVICKQGYLLRRLELQVKDRARGRANIKFSPHKISRSPYISDGSS
jgi:hypothetical protein